MLGIANFIGELKVRKKKWKKSIELNNDHDQ